jgi:hypothetical protein
MIVKNFVYVAFDPLDVLIDENTCEFLSLRVFPAGVPNFSSGASNLSTHY